MVRINSYTGEARSDPTPIERTDAGFAIPVEGTLLEAVDVDADEPVVVAGSIGGAALRVEPADDGCE